MIRLRVKTNLKSVTDIHTAYDIIIIIIIKNLLTDNINYKSKTKSKTVTKSKSK